MFVVAKMKAAVWYGQKDVRVEDREVKAVGDHDVKDL